MKLIMTVLLSLLLLPIFQSNSVAGNSVYIQQDNQDKVNTIWSDKTSVIQLRDMNKEVFPKYDSYQLMIPLEEEDLKAFNDVGYRDNFSRIKEILAMLVTHIRIFDEKAGMITWKEERYMSNAI